MTFGSRLAEERKRLGLRQAEFADLVGTDVPKQSLYENGRRELRADYLARLAEARVDVLYVLTGARSDGRLLSPDAGEVITLYAALPLQAREAVLALLRGLGPSSGVESVTLHAPTTDYRPDDRR
ncbi:helix-turn-helix domain-containing protein [Allosphingosinicella vermicomposti]|uniref:helix-turn-helix domain-containing protein n=1 Tax=Allosphingosinicella vermicomposti TaxID=614671 RepID=UPI000D0F80DF|nr:helix-turn-helix transcriptional regulator [Allosphingosinicella vermicomposti]